MTDNLIALFELTVEDNQVRIVDEKHYRLVSGDEISESDLNRYRTCGFR